MLCGNTVNMFIVSNRRPLSSDDDDDETQYLKQIRITTFSFLDFSTEKRTNRHKRKKL